MRFFTQVFIAVAAATALFASSTVEAAVSVHEIAANKLSSIRSHVQSNRDALLSGIYEIQYHAESLEDCKNAIINPTTESVRACLAVPNAPNAPLFETNCAASLTSMACKLDISIASVIWASGSQKGIKHASAFISQASNDDPSVPKPFSLPKSCLVTPVTSAATASTCQTKLFTDYSTSITLPRTCTTFYFNSTSCGDDLKAAIFARINPTQYTPTMECFDAIAQYSYNVNYTCIPVVTLLNNEHEDTADSTIDTQCSAMSTPEFLHCKENIAATAIAQSKCPNYNLGQIKASAETVITIIDSTMSILCTRDGNNGYCLTGLYQNYLDYSSKWSRSNKNIGDKVTEQVLGTMCKSCLLDISDKINAMGGVVSSFKDNFISSLWAIVSAVNTLCIKDPTNNNNYCARVFPSIEALSDYTEQGIIPGNGDYSNICSPCMEAIITKSNVNSRYGNIFGFSNINQLSSMQSTVCAKDNSNNYCVPSMFNDIPTIALALESCTETPTNAACSGACERAVRDLYATKCCYGKVGLTGLTKTMMFSSSYSQYYTRFAQASACVSTLSSVTKKQCETPDFEDVEFSITLDNIDFTAVNITRNDLSALRGAITSDLSLLLGINTDFINLYIGTFTSNGQGGAVFTFRISMDPTTKNNYINNFNGLLQQGIPMANTFTTASNRGVLLIAGEPVRASGQGAISGAIINQLSIAAIITMIAAFAARF